MKRTRNNWVIGTATCLGTAVALTTLSGCQSSMARDMTPEHSESVVTSRYDARDGTTVRVYGLDGLGLKDAPVEEIEAFMATVRDMVVSKEWDRNKSTMKVFGALLTVRTTPENHLLIDDYLSQVRRVARAAM